MAIFLDLRSNASRSVPGTRQAILAVAVVSLCVRLGCAAVTTTGDVTPDPNTTSSGDPLYVGQASVGGMHIDDGSVVHSAASYIGYDATASGTVTISGVGSNWNSQALSIGRSGDGELAITAGAILNTAGPASIGQTASSTGAARIHGAGSKWTVLPYVNVGDAGRGELIVEEGGALSGSVRIGFHSNSEGTVTVRGANSNLTGQILVVGEMGRGHLAITDGASVVTTLSSQVGDRGGLNGRYPPSDGSVTISGAGSTWTNEDNLAVGLSGKGQLTIIDGGTVSAENAWIGFNIEPSSEDSEGTVTVTGAGSTFTTSEHLSIGGTTGGIGAHDGKGALNIGPGGLVRTGFSAYIAPQSRLKLDGGTFSSGIIRFYSASTGEFEWTAGKLHVVQFERSLVNSAGTLAPGEPTSVTMIDGDYTQQSAATLEIEIGGSEHEEFNFVFDFVEVDGSATLGGTLDVRLVDLGEGVFSPSAGDTFEILTATGGIVNRFEHEVLPALNDLEWQVNYGPNAVSLIVMLLVISTETSASTRPIMLCGGKPVAQQTDTTPGAPTSAARPAAVTARRRHWLLSHSCPSQRRFFSSLLDGC